MGIPCLGFHVSPDPQAGASKQPTPASARCLDGRSKLVGQANAVDSQFQSVALRCLQLNERGRTEGARERGREQEQHQFNFEERMFAIMTACRSTTEGCVRSRNSKLT
eukprot:768778-Hanusia_phi.AAC.3